MLTKSIEGHRYASHPIGYDSESDWVRIINSITNEFLVQTFINTNLHFRIRNAENSPPDNAYTRICSQYDKQSNVLYRSSVHIMYASCRQKSSIQFRPFCRRGTTAVMVDKSRGGTSWNTRNCRYTLTSASPQN